jgi:TRAP-type C4-dicarboxylate transport system substrate-binding protein
MVDAAKYITDIDQPAIFIIAEVNKKWYESLPKDLQHIIDADAAKEDKAIVPIAAKMNAEGFQQWKSAGGTLIKLPGDEEAQMLKTVASVGADVSKSNPRLAAAYKIVTDAAAHVAVAAK